MKKGRTIVILLLCVTPLLMSQQRVDLAQALQKHQIDAVNRTITLYDNHPGAVELNAGSESGMGILEEVSFRTGVIEIELLGENNPGRSFIGVAFNISGEKTYEAVYFRPFNFVATEQERRSHMVQYISHPDYTWSRLREERTGEFENRIYDPPEPDNWFTASIKVEEGSVEVFVDGLDEPVLRVERLSPAKSDKIGLWVGNGSSGRFRNLVVIPN
jgi:hypothetical protein